MDKTLEKVCVALENLGESVLKAHASDEPMNKLWGWSNPALTRHDLANMVKDIATRIRSLNIEKLDTDTADAISIIPERIEMFKKNTLVFLFNGNGNHASSAYFSLLAWINALVQPLFSWESMQEHNALPKQLLRKLRAINAELNEIVPAKEELNKQIKIITEATEAAESLPADLELLQKSRNDVTVYSNDAAAALGIVEKYLEEISKHRGYINDKKEEMDKLIAETNDISEFMTTKGLAGAFDQRANRLARTMWLWVIGLLLALGGGFYFGAQRFETISEYVKTANPQWGFIWMEFGLSLLSLAAPIWFAWLATRQIGQRFRLSEDYAYKATLAKAYIGYSKETANVDPELAKRLLASALAKMDEAPLRLIEHESHSSPWHEALSSDGMKNLMKTFPELKEKFGKAISRKENGIGKAETNGVGKTEID